MTAWGYGPECPTLLTPAEVRRELGVCQRTFANYRKRGGPTWTPAERRQRGYKGEVCLWRPEQVARMRSEILLRRKQGKAAANDRLGHARTHHLELQNLGRLAWECVRLSAMGSRLRAIGCDLPLTDIPRELRSAARLEITRALSLVGREIHL